MDWRSDFLADGGTGLDRCMDSMKKSSRSSGSLAGGGAGLNRRAGSRDFGGRLLGAKSGINFAVRE